MALRGRFRRSCSGSFQSRRLYKSKVRKKEVVVYTVMIDNSDQVFVSIFLCFASLLYFIHFLLQFILPFVLLYWFLVV